LPEQRGANPPGRFRRGRSAGVLVCQSRLRRTGQISGLPLSSDQARPNASSRDISMEKRGLSGSQSQRAMPVPPETPAGPRPSPREQLSTAQTVIEQVPAQRESGGFRTEGVLPPGKLGHLRMTSGMRRRSVEPYSPRATMRQGSSVFSFKW